MTDSLHKSSTTSPTLLTLKFTLIVILLFIALIFSACHIARWTTSRERTKWKTPALQRLAELSFTNEIVLHELKQMESPSSPDLAWANAHVLRMANGEYIIYEYRHGRNIHFPPHLFLGRASDGQWLYSSYHFCNSMAMVKMENPPASIADFAKKYSARPFDGKSDACLTLTQ